MTSTFTYDEFITRNIGFVSLHEQEVLKHANIFIPGVGGMGGAALACLARIGVCNFTIADIDTFEISNLNRQIFSSMDVIGSDKAEVAQRLLQKINPQIKVEIRNGNWVNDLDNILKNTDLVINGCDDIKATIHVMRKCEQHKIHAIDAFASPLPNVYVIRAGDKRPEEVFGFPTLGVPLESITKEMEATCLQKEVEHVAVHSNSLEYVDMRIAGEILTGKRKRISFAPMVWTTGCLMSYEAVRLLLNKKGGAGGKGIFFNPWTLQVEKPKSSLMAGIRRYFVKRVFKQLAR